MGLSHYTQPESPPEIRPVSYSRLIEMLCEGTDCNAIAYSDDKQATIFYDDRLELEHNIGAQGFIVHEMVHYLQHQAGLMNGKSMACEQRMQLEREARPMPFSNSFYASTN